MSLWLPRGVLCAWLLSVGGAACAEDVGARVRGMLLGGMIGDAAGGPVEFVEPGRWSDAGIAFRSWGVGERLPADLGSYGAGLELLEYSVFRPEPEGYAHWYASAPGGTLTDDTRHKAVLIEALRESGERGGGVTAVDLAGSYVSYVEDRADGAHGGLAREGLGEYVLASRWVLGERDPSVALPPARLWGGMGTCAGQMTLPPLAGVHAGDPEGAYVSAYSIGFIDQGPGKDLNAAIVAGLAEALVIDAATPWEAAWFQIKSVMRDTDPYGYGEVPWVARGVDGWISAAERIASSSDGSPTLMLEGVVREVSPETWWEAETTFVMAAVAMEVAGDEPEAALRLAIELGYDTDSTAQLVGLFLGALRGEDAFDASHIERVERAFEREYGEGVDGWVEVLLEAGECAGR